MDSVDQIVELMDVYNVILFLLELVIYVEMDIELMQKEHHVLWLMVESKIELVEVIAVESLALWHKVISVIYNKVVPQQLQLQQQQQVQVHHQIKI